MAMLAVRSRPDAASFAPSLALGLPEVVETAGWVLPFGEEYRLWINRPAETKTLQFRIAPPREIGALVSLPLTAAGVASCGEGFVVTGAAADGRPMALGTDAAGNPLWQHAIDGPEPSRWPMPGCRGAPIILWQTEERRVEVAAVGPAGLGRRSSFPVGGPPLDLAVGRDSIWAVWSDPSGILAVEVTETGAREFRLSPRHVSDVALSVCAAVVCVAWSRSSSAWLTTKQAGHGAFAEPCEVELREAVGGRLRILAGDEPLLFASRGLLREDEPVRMESVLTGPGLRPTAIEGWVHALTRRDDTVVLMGETKLLILRRAA
jgi:hypothetical protein